uniref:Uncharacterized protein n=1 Tax=Candidatus Kentrum sp. TUN TaxID=2126343 RepID=A0A450ZUY4_9GAMM|nr:MAG: hypothetical protein BECKTUN1418D_GA0071000_10665 [Candidatus Kentron sp. TUN]
MLKKDVSFRAQREIFHYPGSNETLHMTIRVLVFTNVHKRKGCLFPLNLFDR